MRAIAAPQQSLEIRRCIDDDHSRNFFAQGKKSGNRGIHHPWLGRGSSFQKGQRMMISAAFPYEKHSQTVLGYQMAYREVGEGDPIVFLHGNPASSYVWRNIIPHLQGLGRCLAPDLIGMGDSDKLHNSGPGSYGFFEHRSYLDRLLETLEVRERVTFVLHD